MIYLDNAATSFPKPNRVYDEMDRCLREYCANPGRGGHQMSIKSGKEIMKAREVVSSFFNVKNPLRLCFTRNATEALNFALKGFLKEGDHVITTCMEHNAVMRPLKTLEKDIGIEITILKGDKYGRIDTGDIKKKICSRTALIVCTVSSNVNGIVFPVKEIGEIAKENNVTFLVDASQGAGTIKIDVESMHIDMLAFPGHKGLLGPQGTGGLYVREGLNIKPIIQGGTGSNSESIYQPEFMPDILESGTLNTPGIIGLRYGIEFINSIGLENLKLHKHMLTKRLHEGIEGIDKTILYSLNSEECNSGIVAMNFKEADSTEISYVLDREFQIATRAGLHCA
ncbi:MAG TPA: aminotransferase class V-fold PLP-dependent enzyme, partial [Clostridiaceae bacterium]|nr:aminotransferase class V-fold PLP-dependent enzyme [Clostridiaceae bacterium]